MHTMSMKLQQLNLKCCLADSLNAVNYCMTSTSLWHNIVHCLFYKRSEARNIFLEI